MVFLLFAPFVAPLVLVGSVILIDVGRGFLGRFSCSAACRLACGVFSCRSCLVVSFVVSLVVSSCCFSFRLSCRVSGRCVVGLSMRAGGRGERKLEEEAHPPASTPPAVYPPALVGYFEAWELGLVVFVRRVFFFAVVGRCGAICGVVLLWRV